ncbi:cid1 family poly A polymerase domain-containing protein [Sarocladium implicatum]|nr:cid1 family poly A polymerase domain-containing protein [Sarocladium implicatum]
MEHSTPAADSQQHPYTPNGPAYEKSSYFAAANASSPASIQATDGSLNAAAAAVAQPSAFPPGSSPIAPYPYSEFLPIYLPQASTSYHNQLLQYNRLISPSRGGGLQTPPLPPIVSSSTAQAGGRSRSSSKVSLKDSASAKGSSGGGHGGRSHHNSDKNRSVIASKDVPPKMSNRHHHNEPVKGHTSRSAPATASHAPSHSASVPSTPHQHARKFSFESRDPSPTAANNHSPRSAYSETTATVPPSLKNLPPRLGGCKFETAQINSRRRIPYSVGNERLETLDLSTVKSKLSEDEERKLATDMREVYDRLLPTQAVEESRQKLVQKLETIFNEEWPGHDIRVNLFGSSGNFLCSDDSDVDICITTSWQQLEDVCMIAALLARKGFEKVVCISAAKVPIVKVWDPTLGLACDMNVNNTLALENTRMIRTYVETDPRVRQLAMLVKYWTRRRKVNDAAFGGTLSSYTWICLIIAFLQVRNPPVLPALHQLPFKLPRPDGQSEFADNLKRLKGYGKANKSSEAELLFQFFRFYAHEFDYDKHVLSVRMGKLVTKAEKKWIYALNNQLCVEEPFNTSRNLGNTADEYSFRGLHLEIRRAFDLIADGKFEEACETYIFPKEEEKVWSRPAPQPRPVLLRSASQTHSGRGGRGNHRGNRNNNNHRGNSNFNRRASSSIPTYDANFMVPQMAMQPDMSWYYNVPFAFPYVQQDLMTHMYPQQQENLRQWQLYSQQQAAALSQQQANGQPRVPTNASLGQQSQQSSDRSRTNSFDNAPMSAPPRTEPYPPALYTGMPLGQPFIPQGTAAYGPYVASPVMASGNSQDFRRALQRSTVATDSGGSASSSSMRSQSQPASRPQNANYTSTQYAAPHAPPASGGQAVRNANGFPIPSFIPDEANLDDTPKGKNASPPTTSQQTAGRNDLSPSRPAVTTRTSPNAQTIANGSIAFGDLGTQSSSTRRRRLSTDVPQTILDRRMRRTSRSPSPMGHTRAISVGAGPTPLAGEPLSAGPAISPGGPLVVNGSGAKGIPNHLHKQPSGQEAMQMNGTVPHGFENPLQVSFGQPAVPTSYAHTATQPMMGANGKDLPNPTLQGPTSVASPPLAPSVQGPLADDTSFRERIANMSIQSGNNPLVSPDAANPASSGRLSPSTRLRLFSRQPQSVAIAPLDLAFSGEGFAAKGADSALLSPVYEHRTPSPTVIRNGDIFSKADMRQSESNAKGAHSEPVKADEKLKLNSVAAHKPSPLGQPTASPRENGHVRGAKSETDGGWQKAGKGRKKGSNVVQHNASVEQPPKNTSERKGG